MSRLARPIAALATAPEIVGSLLAPATPCELAWKPPRGRWSIEEVLGHLVQVEGVLRRQSRRVVDEDDPILETYDPEAESPRTAGRRSVVAGLCQFRRLRRESVEWLSSLPIAAAERSGRHPQVGPLRLEQIVHLWAFHDLGHVRQMTEVLRAASHWEGLGPLRRLYRVRP